MFAGEQHHSAPTLDGQWVPPSAALGSLTTWDINGLLGRWQSSYGFFGSSSTATEVASFTPAGIEAAATLLQAQEKSLGFAVQTRLRAGEN